MRRSEFVPRIALVGAMHEELSAVLALMQDASCHHVAGREFWVGHLQGHRVVAVLSGIGKVLRPSRLPFSSKNTKSKEFCSRVLREA
jgi:hypothetical protein